MNALSFALRMGHARIRGLAVKMEKFAMPEDRKNADVEKLLADEKTIEDPKRGAHGRSAEQKEAAIRDFDEKLAKSGLLGGFGQVKTQSP